MRLCTKLLCLPCLLLALVLTGCSSEQPKAPPKVAVNPGKATDDPTTPNAAATDGAAKPPVKPKAEDVRLEPFDAPPLADLDAKADWQDQPVLDSMKLLRDRQAKEKVLATVTEAMGLRNTSATTNEKISSAIGRLPESETDVNWDAAIIRHYVADVRSTNPIMQSSTIEQEVLSLIGIYPFAYDWNFNPYADAQIVTSWQSSKDRLMDKVVLRDDLTWSDGKPITAHDVEFTFQTIMNPKVPVPAVRSGTDKLRWVKAYDDRTVVFFHKQALATNVWNTYFPLLPKHIYENSLAEDYTMQDSAYHVKYENSPVCSGAYTLAKRDRGQSLLLERRESYYMHNGKQVRDKPYFKEVRIRIIEDPNTALLALKGGDIEEMELQPEQWTTQTGGDDFYRLNTKIAGLQWIYSYFGWNIDPVQAPFFTEKKVRQAMSYAFDHEEMLNTLLYGLYEPSNGVFHRTAWMAPKNPPKPYRQDLDKAQDLLDEAGWEDHDGDGIRDKTIDGKKVNFDFTVVCSNQPVRVAICTLLKTNLEEIGVRCNVSPMDFPSLQEKVRKHEFQAHMGAWGTGADPDTSDNLWVTGEGRNFVQYSNPKVDALYEQGRKEFDRDKRAAIYGQIHQQLYEDQPYTWLYFRNGFYGLNKDLRGIVFSPRGPYSYSPGFNSIWKGME